VAAKAKIPNMGEFRIASAGFREPVLSDGVFGEPGFGEPGLGEPGLAQPGLGTDLLEKVREDERLTPNDNGDHERFAHYVRKEKITESMVTGKPVTALCGKKWVPSRDPEKFPVCPTCKEIYNGLKKE